MPTLADDIHGALLTAVKGATYHRVSHPGGVRTTSAIETEAPKTVLIKPVSCTWDVPERNRSRGFRERTTWLWDVYVEFSREVSLEAFEDANTNSLLRLVRTATQPQVDLLFEEAEYLNPPEQQPAGGTRVKYRVRAELTPL